MIAEKARGVSRGCLSSENLDQFFELEPHLVDELLALIEIDLRIVAGKAVARAADREPLFVEQAPNLPNDEHILALIVTPIAAPLDRLQLRKFLLPVAQHVRLHAAQIAHFADGEVALPRDRRQFGVIAWFQHTPRRGPSIFDRDGRLRRDAR